MKVKSILKRLDKSEVEYLEENLEKSYKYLKEYKQLFDKIVTKVYNELNCRKIMFNYFVKEDGIWKAEWYEPVVKIPITDILTGEYLQKYKSEVEKLKY